MCNIEKHSSNQTMLTPAAQASIGVDYGEFRYKSQQLTASKTLP